MTAASLQLNLGATTARTLLIFEGLFLTICLFCRSLFVGHGSPVVPFVVDVVSCATCHPVTLSDVHTKKMSNKVYQTNYTIIAKLQMGLVDAIWLARIYAKRNTDAELYK